MPVGRRPNPGPGQRGRGDNHQGRLSDDEGRTLKRGWP